jgi:hypothetical protein
MSDNVVSCNLMGGLGNVLFQVFTTISYGMRNSRKIIFPYSDTLNTGIVRKTNWDNLLSPIKRMTTFDPSHKYTNRLFSRFSCYNEPEFCFHEIPAFNYKEILLNGYFQSYKYFDNEKYTIFSLIRLRKQQENIVNEYPLLLQKDESYETISMHFRLGDYVHIQDSHPLMPYQYYENALRYILTNIPNKKFKVLYFRQQCDNDTVENIIGNLKTCFPEVLFEKIDDNIEDWKQLLIMSCCSHNIIANSTFSWWASYFNEKTMKIVCYPSLWFGNKLKHDTKDLFPSSWSKISIEKKIE